MLSFPLLMHSPEFGNAPDPRSSDINSEAGLYVESTELAEQVLAYMDEGVRGENSYRVLQWAALIFAALPLARVPYRG
jgi:phosphatidylserine/phosphatidylglycerophosphate/cardiolipin synthase-like enzyme